MKKRMNKNKLVFSLTKKGGINCLRKKGKNTNEQIVCLDSNHGIIDIPEIIRDRVSKKPIRVEMIGPNVFDFRHDLRILGIPKYVEEIKFCFYDCRNLEEFNIDKENCYFTVIDGVLFSKDRKKLIYHPSANGIEYHIPEGTEEICNMAFKCNYSLKRLWCPSTLKKIGVNAFYDCPVLEHVFDIPESLQVFMRERRHTNHNVTTAKFYVGKEILSIGQITFKFSED